METSDVLDAATDVLTELAGRKFDVLELRKPVSISVAVSMAKVISKLSPMLGNLIEFNVVEVLNDSEQFLGLGTWKRQDPGFPDAVFLGEIDPIPGLEIKAWFPLATEITARFKGSQNALTQGNTYVALIAWLPEFVVYGCPRIIDVCLIEGGSVARARDAHYHAPPKYLVIEPEDTSMRTSNLQQTTTSGYVLQKASQAAENVVESWGPDGRVYLPTPEYKAKLIDLRNQFDYRLDTNYAKMDRIQHPEVEAFKARVLEQHFQGMTIKRWAALFSKEKARAKLGRAFSEHLDIKDEDAEALVK